MSEAQYLLFSAIAMAFVAFSLLQPLHRLPQIPDLLLALTGASALAYTLEKRKPWPGC